MGHRSEQRIVISFPVIVTGFDSRGSPFNVTAETLDISCTGACLKGLDHVAEAGKKIEIECQDQRAWFRVQWVAHNGSAKTGKVGVRCLEPGKYIWACSRKSGRRIPTNLAHLHPPLHHCRLPATPVARQQAGLAGSAASSRAARAASKRK